MFYKKLVLGLSFFSVAVKQAVVHTDKSQESFDWAQASSLWFWCTSGTNELGMPSAGGRVCQATKWCLTTALDWVTNIPVNETLQITAIFPWVASQLCEQKQQSMLILSAEVCSLSCSGLRIQDSPTNVQHLCCHMMGMDWSNSEIMQNKNKKEKGNKIYYFNCHYDTKTWTSPVFIPVPFWWHRSVIKARQ